ncbi:hypothetical protein JOF56_005503 [Kibdelosporangium banguiense]|uniref:Uncharacterized protein n=1 Tax=Kibdelosporangium banguiense TaxID=1365924 RepID=A0ABS4TMG4_9PSEU|nr:hypothetical protein [Kibdelosporangium banguiense]MBP2325118.1 hypothetical protein [Kibdelosporangium banguiense]
MINLVGYLFDGPRLLAGWVAPARPAVYAVLSEAAPNRFAVIYAGQSSSLDAEGFPFRHPQAHRWIARAGSKWKVHIACYDVPGGTSAHRGMIVNSLIAAYRPSCNRVNRGSPTLQGRG